MEHIVTVLHISDLHARGPREPESWRCRRVTGKESWCRNLEELQKDGPIDLVCFTGDLALSGRSDEYPRAGEFLAQTLQQLGLPTVRLAVVPGNHDIDRSVKQGVGQTIRSNIHRFDDLEISRWLAGREAPFGFTDDLRDKLLERQSAFRGWLAAAGFHHLLPSRSPHGRLGFRHTLRLPGLPFDVRLIGLDSAWLCGDDSDDGRLRLTTDQVMRLARGQPRERPSWPAHRAASSPAVSAGGWQSLPTSDGLSTLMFCCAVISMKPSRNCGPIPSALCDNLWPVACMKGTKPTRPRTDAR